MSIITSKKEDRQTDNKSAKQHKTNRLGGRSSKKEIAVRRTLASINVQVTSHTGVVHSQQTHLSTRHITQIDARRHNSSRASRLANRHSSGTGGSKTQGLMEEEGNTETYNSEYNNRNQKKILTDHHNHTLTDALESTDTAPAPLRAKVVPLVTVIAPVVVALNCETQKRHTK